MAFPNFLTRLRQDNGANVLAMAAIMMPVMIGAAGLGVDTIQWTLTQRQMQRMADTAALAGAFAKSQGFTASTSVSAALTANNLTTMNRSPVIENPPTTGSYAKNSDAVRIVLSTTKPLPFSSLFLKTSPLIQVEATAAAVNTGTYCVLALESSRKAGVSFKGSATVDMGCGIATNATGRDAVTVGKESSVTASPISAVGGLKSSRNYAPGTVLLPHSKPQQDPFASLPDIGKTVPSICKGAKSLAVQANNTVSVANPTGTACYRGISLKGKVTFAPGIYYIITDGLDIAASANVSGDGVTFLLIDVVSPYPTVSISGDATVNLTATTTGTYAGVLIYQQRNASSKGTNTITGNSTSKLQGVIYMPAQKVTIAGTTDMNTKCLQIVARTVEFSGSTKVENECPTNSGVKSFYGTRVFLVG